MELQRVVLAVNAHVTILKKGDFADPKKVARVARDAPHTVAAHPFTVHEMLSKRGNHPVLVKGVPPDEWLAVMDMARYVVAGSPDLDWDPESEALPPALIGRRLADAQDLEVGDVMRLKPPKPKKGWAPTAPTKPQDFRLIGLFRTDFAEYDRRLLITHLEAAQASIGRGDLVSGVELRVEEPEQAEEVAKSLQQSLGESYLVVDWCELNSELLADQCDRSDAGQRE